MVVAQAQTTNVERHDLKSLPGGWVDLRPLTYGEILKRRSMTRMVFETQKGKNANVKGEMDMATDQVTLFEFSRCIVDHNLEKIDGVKFNLTSAVDIQMLDPKVGTEIDVIISEMNNFEDDEEDFSTGSE